MNDVEDGVTAASSGKGVRMDAGHVATDVDPGRVLDLAPDPVAVLQRDGTIVHANPALHRLMARGPTELVGTDLLADCDQASVEAARTALQDITTDVPWVGFRTSHDPDGAPDACVEWQVRVDPVTGHLYAFGRDIAPHLRRQAELEAAALTDPLTGLPNRAHILRRLGRMVASRHPVAVLFVDLDDFKPINDRFGHGAGDTVLVEVAARIGRTTRAGEEAARIGGDEFVLLVPDPDGAEPLAARIREELSAPFAVAGTEVRVSASIGIVVSGTGASTTARLLHEADQALYDAKARGGATAVIRRR